MKKMVLIIALLVNILNAQSFDSAMQNQCFYSIDSKTGTNIKEVDYYMLGFVTAVLSSFPDKELSDFLKEKRTTYLIKRACVEALLIKEKMKFVNKFLIGVNVTAFKKHNKSSQFEKNTEYTVTKKKGELFVTKKSNK